MNRILLAFAITLTLAVSISGVQAAPDLTLSVRSSGLDSVTAYNGNEISYEVVGVLSNTANGGLAGFTFDLVYSGGDLSPVQPGRDLRSFVIPAGFTNGSGFGGSTTVPGGDVDLGQIGGAQNTIRNTKEKNLFPLGSVVPELGWTEIVLATGSLLTPEAAGDYTLSIPLGTVKANVIKTGENGFPFWATEAVASAITNALTITVVELLPPRLPEATQHQAPKNRYISIDPTTNGSTSTAYRVTLTEMYRCHVDSRRSCDPAAPGGDPDACPGICTGDYDQQCTDDGQCGGAGPCIPSGPCEVHSDVGTVIKWINEPFTSNCTPLNDCTDQSFAYLVDSAVYRIWTEGVVHISDCQVIPAAAYDVEATFDGDIYSTPLTVATIAKPTGVHYGDVVGIVTGGAFTPPQGVVNATDVQAYLIANQGGATAPHTTWVDLHSSSVPVVPQQTLNIGDLQTIKFGFLAQTYVETPGQENPGDCPPRAAPRSSGGSGAPFAPPGGGGPAAPLGGGLVLFTLVPSAAQIDSGQAADVKVFVDSVDDLMAYEVSLEVTGGDSGQLDLTDIVVDQTQQDWAFAAAPGVTKGGVVFRRQAFAAADAGVAVIGPAYLATFSYQTTVDTSGTFQVSVRSGQDILILNDSDGQPYQTDIGIGTAIEVIPECVTGPDCDDGNDCTIDTCVNYECVNDNEAQGTPCDDGLFCTAIDTCDGAGTCTGRASPCPRFYTCNELNDTCIFTPPSQ